MSAHPSLRNVKFTVEMDPRALQRDTQRVHVVGSANELGSWKPAGNQTLMKRIHHSLYFTATIAVPARAFSYKYVVLNEDGALWFEEYVANRELPPDRREIAETWNKPFSPWDPVWNEEAQRMDVDFNFRR